MTIGCANLNAPPVPGTVCDEALAHDRAAVAEARVRRVPVPGRVPRGRRSLPRVMAGAVVVCTLLWGGVGEPARAGVVLEAYFAKRSYGPGQRVPLRISGGSGPVEVQLFRAGGEQQATRADNTMNGVPVTPVKVVQPSGQGWGRVAVWIGRWPSGLYFARLRSADGQRAFAPFVLRAAPRHRARVAVVMPTNTWQAYNF